MKMTRISVIALLAAATVLAYSPTVRAQDAKEGKDAPKRERGGGADFVKQRLDRLAEELKLTDAQKPKVEAALKAQAEAMRGARDLSQEERRDKMRSTREEFNKKMKEILTAEQYEKFEKLPTPGRGPGGPEGGKKKAEKN
jgi:Spy/CpxP family protein refolding chaperone